MSGSLSPHMKIKKGRPLVNWPGGNTPPVINITAFDAAPDIPSNPFTTEYVAVATDAEQGDISANIVWNIASAIATRGDQVVDLDTKSDPEPSGLANDATVYTATITVDGGAAQPIAITGSAAQTIGTLVGELNADTTGANWNASGVGLTCTSLVTGVSSTILLVDTDLFSAVTDFVAINAATAGVDQVNAVGGNGGTPSISFLVGGVQTIEASITDAGALTATDTETINVDLGG